MSRATAAPLPERVVEMIERGYKLIPLCHVRSDGSCSCCRPDCRSIAKHPTLPNWEQHATNDRATIERWRRAWPECGFGWVMGDELIALDLENKNGLDGVATLHQLEQEYGRKLPRDCVARTPTGGHHMVLQNPDGQRFTASTGWRSGIDIRTGNSYIAVEPTVTPDGAYGFDRFGVPGLAPDWLLGILPERSDEASAGDTTFTLNEAAELPERAAELLKHGSYFRDTFNHTRSKDGDQSDSAWDYAVLAAFLRSYRDATDQELCDLLVVHRDGSWGAHRDHADYARRTIASVRASADPQAPEDDTAAAESATDEGALDEPYALEFDDFIEAKLEAPVPLIGDDREQFLPVGGLLLLIAKGGKGKTTFSIDAAMHLASGITWLGNPVPRPLNILIIENEGPREPFRQKLERKRAKWPHGRPGRIYIRTVDWGAFLVSDSAEKQRLRRFIEDAHIDLVIGDPLDSMGMEGVGSPEDTRKFCDHLVDVGLKRDATFWLLHHSVLGRDWKDEIDAASGAWGQRPDTMLHLSKEPGNRARLAYGKVRWGAVGSRPANILSFDPDTQTFAVVGEERAEERDLLAEIYAHLNGLADPSYQTLTEIAAPARKGGIGANRDTVGDILKNHPDRFFGAPAKAVGKKTTATYWMTLETAQAAGIEGWLNDDPEDDPNDP